MKNKQLSLFLTSQSLAFTYFWIAISIPYLMYRGLSAAQAFSLMSIYQLIGVFLEYPTGVIGDRFGYRRVTYLANFFNFTSMLLMTFSGNYLYYLFCLFLLSLGNGFSSGNDMGILKTVSHNIKKDTANYNSLMDFILFLSSIVGGFISRISYELALLVSACCMLSANIPLYFIRASYPQVKNTKSLALIAREGFGYLSKPIFRQIFIIVAVFGGYGFTQKSILGSFGTLFHVDVMTIGILVGLGGLGRSIGAKLYAIFQKQFTALLTILISIFVLLVAIFPVFIPAAFLLITVQILFGYLLSKIDGDIHELASDDVRASLFSLKRLTMRIVAASYLMIYGLALDVGLFPLMMFGTCLFLVLGIFLSRSYLFSQKTLSTN